MADSPRTRRLRSDLRAIQALRTDSSILSFEPQGSSPAPEAYLVQFHGTGTWRPAGKQEVQLRDCHEVLIRLGANYPRMMPELTWRTPIFHPNISSSGFVCLGGYGTFWAPGLHLDDLCVMLWDMVRYANYDENSPYNREAALWVRTQQTHKLPLDARPLRDRRAAAGSRDPSVPDRSAPDAPVQAEIVFLGDVVEAEVFEAEVFEAEVIEAEVIEEPAAVPEPVADKHPRSDVLFIE